VRSRRFRPFAWLSALRQSLRLKFLAATVLCAFGALFITIPITLLDDHFHHSPRDYARGMERIDEAAHFLARALDSLPEGPDRATLQRLTDEARHDQNSGPLTARVINREGREMLSTAGHPGASVDLSRSLREAAALRTAPERYPGHGTYTAVHAIAPRGELGYLLVTSEPLRQHEWCTFRKVVNGAWPFLVVALFFAVTRRKLAQLRTIGDGLSLIAAGQLDHRVPEPSPDEFGTLARNVNAMASTLQRNLEAERRAERTKDELIANVSHDLRTPLTSIMGYLDLVRRGRYESPSQLADYVGIAWGKAEQLHRLVEDLFEYVRLNDPHVHLARRVVCINALVAQLASEYVPLCEDAGLTLETQLAPGRLPLSVDPERLVRVLENLLSNAIKYSHKPGRVRIRVHDAWASVQITVENTGPTLEAEDLERLFERFFRVDAARSSTVRGAGLGLVIAKSIVDLHEGQIGAESEEGLVRIRVRLSKRGVEAV
jgi:signal transduction histidine kinase